MVKGKKRLDISEVAKISGLPVSTLRYYEDKQLIKSVGRRGLRRLFNTDVLEQLNFIALGRRARFPLGEIAQMINAEGRYQIDREQLLVKAEELDIDIKQLRSVRDCLRHAAVCPEPSHQECPTFQKRLRAAGVSQKKIRKKEQPMPIVHNKF